MSKRRLKSLWHSYKDAVLAYKDAVLELAKANPNGISNSDAASLLGLRSDYGGGSKDYLSYSVLGILMREGKLERSATNKKHVARVQ